jgi:MFS family permease
MEGRYRDLEPRFESTPESEAHFRRNFFLGVLNGTLYIGGLAFSQPSTILPVFVALFTKSSVLIGLTGTLTSVGWLLPQLAVARYAEHLPKKLRLYGLAAICRLVSWLGLVVSVTMADDLDPGTYLILFFICLGGFSLTGGASGIAFLDIVGKTIPPAKRGRYFAYRRFFSGIIAAAAGSIVAYVLGNPDRFPFPKNYFLLFSLTFGFLVSAIAAFMFTIEPRGTVKPEREKSSSEYLSKVREVVSKDGHFRKFLMVMVLSNTSSLSIPFYAIYATSILGAPISWVGWYVTIDTLTILLSNLVWGYMGDAGGYRRVIRICALLSMAAPFAALLSPNYYIFATVFVLKGAGTTGLWLAKNNYSLEVAPVTSRPTYVGILNTSLAFVMLLPVVGGLVIDLGSYGILFALTGLLTLVSVVESAKLDEPRRYEQGS